MGAVAILGSEDVKGLTDMIKKEGFDFAVGTGVVEGTDNDLFYDRVMGDILGS